MFIVGKIDESGWFMKFESKEMADSWIMSQKDYMMYFCEPAGTFTFSRSVFE